MHKGKEGEKPKAQNEDDPVYLKAYIKELQEKIAMLDSKLNKAEQKRGSGKKKITFVHYNDVYHLDPAKEEPVGGIARVATSLDQLEQVKKRF